MTFNSTERNSRVDGTAHSYSGDLALQLVSQAG